MKDGIIELRQNDASLRLIRELLATVGVAVSTNTESRGSFAEANHNRNGSLSDHFARVAPERERPTRNLLQFQQRPQRAPRSHLTDSRVRRPRTVDLPGVLRSTPVCDQTLLRFVKVREKRPVIAGSIPAPACFHR
jgi:hypothetical protein